MSVRYIEPKTDAELIQQSMRNQEQAEGIAKRLNKIIPYAEKRIKVDDLRLQQLWVIEEQLKELSSNLQDLSQCIEYRVRTNKPLTDYIKKI